MLLSIDPGLRGCGVALWAHRAGPVLELFVAGYAPTDENMSDHPWYGGVSGVRNFLTNHTYLASDITDLAIELPQVYVQSKLKGDPNDLIMLAGLVGALAQEIPGTVKLYRPVDWKGSTPKDVMRPRIEKRLSPLEMSCVKWPKSAKLQLDVVDGIGIGLKHLSRL